MKFLNVAWINYCKSKKSQQVALDDFDLKGSFERNSQWLLSLRVFFTLKPIPASDHCCLFPKFEQEFDRI